MKSIDETLNANVRSTTLKIIPLKLIKGISIKYINTECIFYLLTICSVKMKVQTAIRTLRTSDLYNGYNFNLKKF